MNKDRQNPWAGLASYEDPETAERKLKFCGRDDDSYDLARLIMGNVFVTLYGKSGIGKTSLLNAGVFPELREEHYTPVSIRLGIRDDEHPQSYQTMIVEAVERVVKRTETINVIDEQQDQHSIDYLWNYFTRHRFYDKHDEPTTPVIVFDQFEEVFRGYRDEAETLLRQLDYLNDKDHTLDSCEVDGQLYRYEQNFRFVVSIREDDLYRMEDSIDNCYLPALKRCRYRLRSLSEDGARDAILIPGDGLFKPKEQEEIVNKIIRIAYNKEDQSISTNLLSLVCNRIFVDFQKSETDHITPSLVDTFIKGNPFERFYNEATRGFSNREKSYIEDHLVDSSGRRNSISESDFLLHIKKGAKLLEGDAHILQRISTSSDGGNYRIELIHDSFCEPLASQKEKREKRRRLKWLAMAVGIVLFFGGVTAFVFSMASKNFRLEGTNQALVDSLTLTLAKVEQERDAVRLANLRKDSANALLAFSNAQLDSSNIQLSLREQALSVANQGLQLANIQKDSANALLAFSNAQLDSSNIQLSQREQALLVANQGFQKNLTRVLVEKAKQLIDDGDYYLARLLALQALPPNKPYMPEAEGALRKAFQYDNAILKGHTDWVRHASFSPDGKLIASASSDMTIRMWDVKTGKCIRVLEGHKDYIMSAAFSPDGKYIVSASMDKTIRIWDVSTGLCIQTLTGHTDRVFYASFNSNGKFIVSASGDKTIRIWDVSTGLCIQTLTGHTDIVYTASFCPNGRYIASASADKTVRIWDTRTGHKINYPLRHTNSVYSASFSPDGNYIVSASMDNTIRLWDVRTGRLVGSPLEGHTQPVTYASFSPDGRYIVSGSWDNTVRIWDRWFMHQVGSPMQGHKSSITSVSFSPDGKYIVSASHDNTIRIWEAGTGRSTPLEGYASSINSASFSPDGKYIVSASWDKKLRIWEAQTGRQVGSPMEGHTDEVFSASFSPDGKYIVSGSRDKTIRIWDVQTGQQVGSPMKGHTKLVNSVSFNPDGKLIVSASSDATIRIWDVSTGMCIQTLEGHKSYVKSASFSPDGNYIVSASGDKTIRIWEVSTGMCIQTIIGNTTWVESASYSPDGNYIVSVSGNIIQIWNVSTGACIQTLEEHIGHVHFASFSPDGRFIISSLDNTIRIWDVSTGLCIQTLEGHTDNVTSVNFSPDGKRIVSVSALEIGDNVRIWDFPPLQELIDQTRERFKDRQLTPEERRKYYLE